MIPVVLASTSSSRAALLRAAGVSFRQAAPGVDEGAAKAELLATGAGSHAIAGALAERKAVAISRLSDGLVIGADQTLELEGVLVDKAANLDQARARLMELRDRSHSLHSAVVVATGGTVLWRETQCATMRMRGFSQAFLDGYLARNGRGLLSSVGCYQLEGEGVQLFAAIEGDHFAILGLPLIGLLAFLRQNGAIQS